MKKLTLNDPEMQSPDLLAQNVERMKSLFPEAFTEGKIDFEVLKELLGDFLELREQRYGLQWNGKRDARRLAITPSLGTLRPCPEESEDWENTQNLIIEGDNLEVLKLLQRSYMGKVKLIYIDPPYNTGKDFVYRDDYGDNIRNYLELTGQVDDEGRRMSSNTETSGRFHTEWLNMMYPRLRLARDFLRKDGVIFISLDDTEIGNLVLVLNEIFGEENFVGTFPWRSRTAKADVPFGVSKDVEWVIGYCKEQFIAGRSGERRYYKSDDYEDRWRLADLTKATSKDERPNSFFTMINPKNGEKFPASATRTWAVTLGTFDDYYRDGKIVFPGDYDFLSIKRPAFRVFEREDKQKAFTKYGSDDIKMSISTYLSEKDVGRTEHGSKEIREIFSSQVFPFPKPTSLIRFFMDTCSEKDSIVLDFFSGSGSTGHAVLEQNAADNGNRQFILVQLPEPTGQKEFPTIAEITKERVRRVIKRLNEADAGKLDLGEAKQDRGFRVFKLAASNLKPWDPAPENLEELLLDHVDNILPDRSEQDLLYELLLKTVDLALTVPIEEKLIAGKQVYSVGYGALMACLSKSISADEVEPLAQGMVAWHSALAPIVSTNIYFRDNAFADDVAKSNMVAILTQNLPPQALAKNGIRSL